ncbi:BRCA1-associated ATM activator 1 isoform X1 [Esox lucius]|uniref:BRCA1-associated ATM activator 1 n=1 Tax=Esox lucius TaxID=8010 RepID=A0AAY5KTH4_ESOLU|nr:BRCA1-associated ATM activator 1 isoform X1 [Esox lucius]
MLIGLREIGENAQLQKTLYISYTPRFVLLAFRCEIPPNCVMDSECMLLLPRVCAVLADPRQSLPDDTSLEKLLDWLTGLTKEDHGQALLESCPCLLDYISTVCLDKTPDPSMLSFSLKLSGLLAASQHGFSLLQDRSVLGVAYDSERWKGAGLWEDPSVRIGWIHGVNNMLQHALALHFLEQAGLTKPILQLQTDPSLFVALAANHLLAHLLTFHQPTTASHTTQRNGLSRPLSEEGELVETTQASSVTMEILRHLENSLVSDNHTQVLQGLRLLSVTLPQAEAALRELLMSRVLRPLEGLVLAGRRDLTQPLMDVLLAAYRSGPCDSRLVFLMTSMLNSQNSSDAALCAAATLPLDTCPPDLREKVAAVLLEPLQAITGVSLLDRHNDQQTDHRRTDQQTDQMDSDQDKQWDGVSSVLLDHLNKKSSCISLICLCVSNTLAVVHTESCASVLHAVMALLNICNGQSSPSTAVIGYSKAITNLIGCSKVQRCGLDALASLSTCSGAVDLVTDVLRVLLQYLHNPDSDATVVQKSYQAMLRWLNISTEPLYLTPLVGQDLLPVLKKRMCDVRWEVRDSTVEFLGHLCVSGVVSSCTITPILLEALSDQQSYVRASAISALAKSLPLSGQQGAAQDHVEKEAVPRVLHILSQDSEGFARRAVVQFFITWLKTHPLSSSSSSSSAVLRSVLSLGSVDLDWEVKCHTLELVDLLMQETLPGQLGSEPGSAPPPYAVSLSYGGSLGTNNPTHTHSLTSSLPPPPLTRTPAPTEPITAPHLGLSGLVNLGVITALLNGLFDCDRPVALKACSLLLRLRNTVCPRPLGQVAVATDNTTVSEVMFDLSGQVWAPEVILRLAEKRECDWAEDGEGVCDRLVGNCGSSSEACGRWTERSGCGGGIGVCEVLWSLGLEERQSVLSRSSDHVQNSPLSLLQDILTATRAADIEEVIVDCY